MKRRWIVWLMIGLLAASLLTGCGAKSSAAQEGMAEEVSMDAFAYDNAAPADPSGEAGREGAKIIYTADLELEATDFDAAAAAIRTLTADCGGYFSSSRLSNGGSYRSASYTVRIPVGQFRAFLDQAGQAAHLLNLREYADDVSEAYYDTDGRLKTQQTKLERLRQLLEQAESMEDIITIESAISETEEQIDWLSGELRRYDSQVDYATITVSLREVSRLSNVPEPAQSFGSRLLASLREGLSGFVSGMEHLLIALAYGWEWLVLIGALLAAVLLLVRRARRRKKARAAKEAAAPSDKAA